MIPSSMPVSVLGVAVTTNNTGGQLGQGFSSSSYKSLSSTATNLITNATYGGNQNFAIKYKATPGFAYSAGTYYTEVVYLLLSNNAQKDQCYIAKPRHSRGFCVSGH